MSLMAAMGRPQLATGPQKCYKKWEGKEGRELKAELWTAAISRTLNNNVNYGKPIFKFTYPMVRCLTDWMVNRCDCPSVCLWISSSYKVSPKLERVWQFTKVLPTCRWQLSNLWLSHLENIKMRLTSYTIYSCHNFKTVTILHKVLNQNFFQTFIICQ